MEWSAMCSINIVTPIKMTLSNVWLQYIPRNMHTVFALLCFVVVIHWLIFPYPSGLLHWHCGNQTIAPVPAKQTWWIWINTSCEFVMNDNVTTTKQSTTKPCAYFLGYICIVEAGAVDWSACLLYEAFYQKKIFCWPYFHLHQSLVTPWTYYMIIHWVKVNCCKVSRLRYG